MFQSADLLPANKYSNMADIVNNNLFSSFGIFRCIKSLKECTTFLAKQICSNCNKWVFSYFLFIIIII